MLLHRIANRPTVDLPADPQAVSLRRLLASEAISTHFQPIFSVRQKAVIGMEALSRGLMSDGRLISPYELFKMAAAERLAAELEGTYRKAAVQNFAGLAPRPDELLLFLNLDLGATGDPQDLPFALERLVRNANLLPRNVAVEFLEARLEDVGGFGALMPAKLAR